MAAIIIISLAGCGSKKREVIQLTLSTEDAEAILNAAGIYLPDAETAASADTVIQLCGCRNDLQNYSDEEMVQTGYCTFRERYHSDVEYVECVFADRWTTLANLMLAGTAPDFYAAWATDFSDPEEALFASTGTFLVEYDPAEGIFKHNLDDPRIERAANRLYDVMKNDLSFPMWTLG